MGNIESSRRKWKRENRGITEQRVDYAALRQEARESIAHEMRVLERKVTRYDR